MLQLSHLEETMKTRVSKTYDSLITEEYRPKLSSVPIYEEGMGWFKKPMFLGIYEWVVVREELLPLDEVEILI